MLLITYGSPMIDSLKGKIFILGEKMWSLFQLSVWRRKLLVLNHGNAVHVENSSWVIHPLIDTCYVTLNTNQESIKSTMKRYINLKIVGRHFFLPVFSEHIKGIILERSSMIVNNVEKSFCVKNHSRATKILTQGWNPMNIKNVGMPWHGDQLFE